MRIGWTELALFDLASARAYIATDKPIAADNQVSRVVTTVAGLAQSPEIGRPGRVTGTRELVIGRTPHIAAYRIRGEDIEILRVLRGRQSWPPSFQGMS